MRVDRFGGWLVDKGIPFAKEAGIACLVFGIGFSISFSATGIGIYAAALLAHALFLRRRPLAPVPQYRLLAVFLLFLGINFLIHHEHPWTSFEGFWKYAGGFLVMYAVVDVGRDEKHLSRLIHWVLLVYSLAVLTAFWQKWMGYDLIRLRPAYKDGSQLRLCGPFKHYNDFGTFLQAGIMTSLSFLVVSAAQKRRISFFIGVSLCLALIWVLINTLSRSAFIGAAAAVFIFLCFFKTRKITLPILLIGVTGLVLLDAPLADRLRQIFNMTEGSTSERLLLARIALSMIRKSPFIGLGMNTYSIYYPQFKPADYPGLMSAHDTFLQMGTEIGLIGVGLFILFIASCMLKAIRGLKGRPGSSESRVLSLGFLCAAAGLLVNGFFESLLQSTQLRALFWLMMGLMLASAFLKERTNNV